MLIFSKFRSIIRNALDLNYREKQGVTSLPVFVPTTGTTITPTPENGTFDYPTVSISPAIAADLAQTFYIDSYGVKKSDMVFITSVDLFLHSKPVQGLTKSGIASPGITVSLCEVKTNNVPDLNSVYHLHTARREYSQIQTDITGSLNAPTTFTFKNPVPVKTDRVYGFLIQCDGSDPDFKFWYNKAGENVLGTTTKTQVSSGRVDGYLFKVTNGLDLAPQQDADLAFRVRVARFNTTSQAFKTKNVAYEILKVTGFTSKFLGGEDAFQVRSAASGTLNISSSGNTITGTGTSFNTYFVAGDKFVVTDGTNGNTDILVVDAITNSSTIRVNRAPKFNNTAATYYKTVIGKVHIADQLTDHLLLRESNANSSLFLTNSTTIRGLDSGASVTIDDIIEYTVNSMVPAYAIATPTGTKAEFTVNFANNALTQSATRKQDVVNGIREFLDYDAIYASRTTEVTATVPFKTFTGEVIFTTSNEYVSPFVREENLDMFIERMVINNSDANEFTGQGNAQARYITKVINLGTQTSEDLKLFLTAYRPAGTSIKVYAKFDSREDIETIDVKDWTELDSVNDVYNSSPANKDDLVELAFDVPFYRDGVVLTQNFTTALSCSEITSDSAIVQPSTFNADSGVANATEYITTSSPHGLVNGDIVTYLVSAGNTVVSGLSNGSNYFVVGANSTALQLSLTAEGTAINITSSVSETGHTLRPQQTIVANDVIRIYSPLFPNTYTVDIVTSVTNSTVFSISKEISNSSLVSSGLKIAKAARPQNAFLDVQNLNVLTYFNKSSAKIEGYDTLVIKVVLLSSDGVKIPYVKNIRAIAVTA